MKMIAGSGTGALIISLLVLHGCVTETTGGLPEPAADDTRVQAHLDLARGYMESGQMDRARGPLDRALKIDPRSAESHVLYALIYTSEGEDSLAEQHFELALSYDRANSQALNNYGSYLYAKGRYEEAAEKLRLLVNDTGYRARAQAFENLGMAELALGNTEAARVAFNRSLQLSFEQPRASLELAEIAFAEGDVSAARQYYDGFRTQARQTPRTLCLGMKLAQAQVDTDQLASYALALQNLFPNSPEARECEVEK